MQLAERSVIDTDAGHSCFVPAQCSQSSITGSSIADTIQRGFDNRFASRTAALRISVATYEGSEDFAQAMGAVALIMASCPGI
jgi:hypothetical protein